jgi:diguanylate cyclase (GGDEF)-like protein
MGHDFTGVLYADSIIFCFVMLAVVLYKAVMRQDKRLQWKIFICVIITTMFFQAADIIWGFAENGYLHLSANDNYVVNAAYYILTSLTSYLCFFYAQIIMDTGIARTKPLRIISEMPMYAVAVLVLLSYRTEWIFYIDEANHYQRGPYTIMHVILSYGYIFFALVQVISATLKKENFQKRKEYLNVLYFILIPGFLCVGQVFIPGIPLVSMGLTGGILLVYMNTEEMLISIDVLTNLSNRNQLYTYLGSKFRTEQDRLALYLLLIDVDYFKTINDQYGHLEGDIALKRVADALKLSCADRKGIVCRYGGDEFIIVCENMLEEEVRQLCSDIVFILHQMNQKAQVPYDLTVSIGYAHCTSEIHYIPELIEAADQELYKVKRAR